MFHVDKLGVKAQKKEFMYDFKAYPNQIRWVRGENGIGKTLLCDSIAGLIKPATGRCLLGSNDILNLPAHRRPVAYKMQKPQILSALTPRENIKIALGDRENGSWHTNELLEKIGLAEPTWTVPSGNLSGGEMQKLSFIQMYCLERTLLILDEPFAGLDTRSTELMASCIERAFMDTQTKFIIVVAHENNIISQISGVEALDLA